MPPFSKQQYHELTNIASVFSKNKTEALIFIFVIGNEKCAQTIRKVAGNYESVLRVLNRINVPAAVAKANGGGGR